MAPSGMLIAYADGVDSARTSPQDIARLVAPACDTDDVRVFLGWTPEEREWLGSPAVRGWTAMAGYALSGAVASGRLRYLPVRLSAVPRLLEGDLKPDVTVVTGVRRGADLAFGSSVGWGPVAAQVARAVVVEIDEDGDLGGPLIPGNIVATVKRPASARPLPSPRKPDEVDKEIGRRVAALVPEGATIQIGPGGMATAILAAIENPVAVWSGLVTDAVAELDTRGMLAGTATAGYVWGGEPVRRLSAAGQLTLRPLNETHDLTRISSIERFVGCNTAIQVGLDGAVNVERAGGRWIAGIGGHADFCAAAARSSGGLSVIALRSTTAGGASTIVAQVELASTPRCDVDVVVTEHGVADLRAVDDEERRRRLVDIAAPAHRDSLLGTFRGRIGA